jgi:hypothetical protein
MVRTYAGALQHTHCDFYVGLQIRLCRYYYGIQLATWTSTRPHAARVARP